MVTKIFSRKKGYGLIKYLCDEESHRDDIERNMYLTTINLMPSPDNEAVDYGKQFRTEWDHMIDAHKVQMRHMIFSASRKEYAVSEENAIAFGETVCKYIEEYYPNRRAIVAVQSDTSGFFVDSHDEIIRNKSGKPVRSENKAKEISGEDDVRKEYVLHAHVGLSDCDMDDYKGVETEKTHFYYLRDTFDEFFTKETGIEIDHGVKRGRAKYVKHELQDGDDQNDSKTYVSFKDDLADRIDQCIAASSNMDSFYNNLPQYGVRLRKNKRGEIFRDSKKNGRYVTFELVDQSRTTDGQRYVNDVMVEGELKKAGSLMRCSLRSCNFDSEGYDLDSIADRIAKHESHVSAKKEKTEVNIHDLYMSKMRESDESEYMPEVNAENKDYFAALKAKAEEADRKRHAGEPEEEQPKPKPYRARGYARTPDPYRQKTEEKKQDPIPEPVIEKQDVPAPMECVKIEELRLKGERLEEEAESSRNSISNEGNQYE